MMAELPLTVDEYMELSESDKKKVPPLHALALLHDSSENGVDPENVAFFEESRGWSESKKFDFIKNGEIR